MVVRITKTADVDMTVLRVDGRLHSRNVAGLKNEYRSIDGPVILDLSDLRFADATAIGVLRDIAATGVRIQGASPYIKLRLMEGASGLDGNGRGSSMP